MLIDQTFISLTPQEEKLRTKIPGESGEPNIRVQFIMKYIPDAESGEQCEMIFNSWVLNQSREALWDEKENS